MPKLFMVRSQGNLVRAAFLFFVLSGQVLAQEQSHWIWHDMGNPAEKAPAGTVWFRHEVKGNEPSTGIIRIASDEEFTLWVNGQKIASGEGKKPYRFNLNGIVERGTNVLAISATNKSGRAGLYVEGEIRGQSSNRIAFHSNASWKSTTTEPKGEGWKSADFEEKGWKAVKDLGAHDQSPWKELAFASVELDRFDLAPGFEVQQIAHKTLSGSVVCMTWGRDGRLLVSQERGPIVSLSDENGDGVFDKANIYTEAVKNCQGLCQVGKDLFAVGDGPAGTGVYKIPDQDGNHVGDEVINLAVHKGGMGEHGPHDIVLGPDGHLYHNLGNHSWVTATPQTNSPITKYAEDYILNPKFEDAGGHAVGILAPGGTVWRFSPDGKRWWLETNGFRNHYDIAFNTQGDLFTFDSDMEWDVGLPWYRPVRVNHCIPGAEFGWRSGAAKWPSYHLDSLPATVDIGRGSPTGIVFYEHQQFPEKYHGTLLLCDWSMGRLIAAKLEKNGSSYLGTFENLVTGNPLNVSDVEVDRDGSVVFCTGGRGTEGGVYRVTASGTTSKSPAKPKTVAELLAIPQAQSAWHREMAENLKTELGDRWNAELKELLAKGTPSQKTRALGLGAQMGTPADEATLITLSKDKDPGVRAFAIWLLADHPSPATLMALRERLGDKDPTVQRRTCEALVRSGLQVPAELIVPLLGSEDRFVRWAARIAMERTPVAEWEALVVDSKNRLIRLYGLLSLLRSGEKSRDELLALASTIQSDDETGQLEQLRLIQLILNDGKQGTSIEPNLRNGYADSLTKMLTSAPPDSPVTAERARTVAYLGHPPAVGSILDLLEKSKEAKSQIHFSLCLRYLSHAFKKPDFVRLLAWYEGTQSWEGGNSLPGYIRNFVSATLEGSSPEDRRSFLAGWKSKPQGVRLVLGMSRPEQIAGFDEFTNELLKEIEKNPSQESLNGFISLTIETLAKSDSEVAQGKLRQLFDQHPDYRDQLSRAIAQHPSPASRPYLLKALQFGDNITIQQSLAALKQIPVEEVKAEELRAAILGGLKIGNQAGQIAVQLLEQWTKTPHNAEKDVAKGLQFYQNWYAEKYPDAPRAELAKVDTQSSKFSLEEIVRFLESDPKAQQASVERGQKLFGTLNCFKCHKVLKEGEGVGPDLTTLRRRFQKKEIVESILLPSQVISDQYKMVSIETKEGLSYNGMPLPSEKPGVIRLLLSDATKLEIAKDQVVEEVPSKTSVMPDGLFKDLSLEQIADLFAYMETTRSNPEPAPVGNGK